MPGFVDVITQIQHVLPRRFGGTGNDGGWGNERLMLPCMNDTGATLTRGTLVKLKASYDDRRVIKTTTAKELGVLGVVVGRYVLLQSHDNFEDADAADLDTVAVCVVGRCLIDVAAAVNVGEFAMASDTDGKAESAVYPDVGTIGQFESSTAGAAQAWIVLHGGGTRTGIQRAASNVRMGDGQAVMDTSMYADIVIPFTCTIDRAAMYADVSGSIVVDISKATHSGYASFTTICNSGGATPPTISSGIKYLDTTLAIWQTSLAKDDILRFNVLSVTSIRQITLALGLRRS